MTGFYLLIVYAKIRVVVWKEPSKPSLYLCGKEISPAF